MPVIFSKPGKRYRHKQLEFWAERGLVHMFDFRNNAYDPDYKVLTVRDALLRADSFNKQISRMGYTDERREIEQLVTNLIFVCKDAKQQGRPDDPKTWDHLGRMRRDKHFLLPGKDVQPGNYKRTPEVIV